MALIVGIVHPYIENTPMSTLSQVVATDMVLYMGQMEVFHLNCVLWHLNWVKTNDLC